MKGSRCRQGFEGLGVEGLQGSSPRMLGVLTLPVAGCRFVADMS